MMLALPGPIKLNLVCHSILHALYFSVSKFQAQKKSVVILCYSSTNIIPSLFQKERMVPTFLHPSKLIKYNTHGRKTDIGIFSFKGALVKALYEETERVETSKLCLNPKRKTQTPINFYNTGEICFAGALLV